MAKWKGCAIGIGAAVAFLAILVIIPHALPNNPLFKNPSPTTSIKKPQPDELHFDALTLGEVQNGTPAQMDTSKFNESSPSMEKNCSTDPRNHQNPLTMKRGESRVVQYCIYSTEFNERKMLIIAEQDPTFSKQFPGEGLTVRIDPQSLIIPAFKPDPQTSRENWVAYTKTVNVYIYVVSNAKIGTHQF